MTTSRSGCESLPIGAPTTRLLSIARSSPHKATEDAFPAEGIGTINGGRGRGDEDRGTTPIVRELLKAVIELNMIKIAQLLYNT